MRAAKPLFYGISQAEYSLLFDIINKRGIKKKNLHEHEESSFNSEIKASLNLNATKKKKKLH